MSKVCIVTDSSAQYLNPALTKQFDITVLPMRIRFGDRVYREGIDLDAEGFFRHILTEGMPTPILEAPSVGEYAAVFSDLARKTNRILVLTMAHGMSNSFYHAQAATQSFMGHCEIIVLDSLTTSVGLGFLVEAAARVAERTLSLENVVRVVRGAVPRVYSIFYVESLDYLFRANLIGESQAILGKMLNIKPFLTIENGELIPMEKARTRSQAVDKLIEFVTEFSFVNELVVLQNTPHITEQTRLLQDRLAPGFSGRNFPVMMYGPSLGTHLGMDGVGLVVYEAEEEEGWA